MEVVDTYDIMVIMWEIIRDNAQLQSQPPHVPWWHEDADVGFL